MGSVVVSHVISGVLAATGTAGGWMPKWGSDIIFLISGLFLPLACTVAIGQKRRANEAFTSDGMKACALLVLKLCGISAVTYFIIYLLETSSSQLNSNQFILVCITLVVLASKRILLQLFMRLAKAHPNVPTEIFGCFVFSLQVNVATRFRNVSTADGDLLTTGFASGGLAIVEIFGRFWFSRNISDRVRRAASDDADADLFERELKLEVLINCNRVLRI